jgi:mycothiol system anti-sigma-R factor
MTGVAMNNAHNLPCDQVLQSLILYIDHELATDQDYQIFQIHFQECPPCNEVMVHESEALAFMQNLLRNTCNEQAPEDLHERIRQQTQTLAGQTQVGFFSSSTTITNFTFDGTTSIQVTQEFTHEIRHDFTEGL